MDPVHDKGVHGPGPYFDGPGPWTGSTEGVHGPGVHVLYFPIVKYLYFERITESKYDGLLFTLSLQMCPGLVN